MTGLPKVPEGPISLSDEDIKRIVDELQRRVVVPAYHPVWIDPRYYPYQTPRYWWQQGGTWA